MKKFLSTVLSALMLLQAVPVVAEVTSDGTVVEPTPAADVVFTIDGAYCEPGDRIALPIYLESSVKANSFAISDMLYDKSVLTFVGFENPGDILFESMYGEISIDNDLGTLAMALTKAQTVSGFLCDAIFEVNADAPSGTVATVGMNVIVKNNSDMITSEAVGCVVQIGEATSAPETVPVVEIGVEFNVVPPVCVPGETIEVGLYVDCFVEADSFALSKLNYDDSILTFVGFANPGEVLDMSMFGEKGMDSEGGSITFAFAEPRAVSGHICDAIFEVNADVLPETSTWIDMISVVRSNGEEVVSMVWAGEVYIVERLEGEEPTVPETEPETKAPETSAPEDAWVEFSMGVKECKPGDTVSLPIYVDGTAVANSYLVRIAEYDTEYLTFVGFENPGDILLNSMFGLKGFDNEKMTVTIGLSKAKALSGRICDAVFEVSADASLGTAVEISLGGVVKNGTIAFDALLAAGEILVCEDPETEPETEAPVETPAPETVAPSPDAPVAPDGSVQFHMEGTTCEPGDRIALPIFVDSTVIGNSYQVKIAEYDAEYLTFVGFENPGDILLNSMFGEDGIDNENKIISLGLSRDKKLSGFLCDAVFEVSTDAPLDTTFYVAIDGIAKLNVDELDSTAIGCEVLVCDIPETVAPETPAPVETAAPETNAPETSVPTDAGVVYTIGDVYAEPGATVALPLYINSSVAANSFMVELGLYDMSILEFVGFDNASDFLLDSFSGEGGMDNENRIVTLGLARAKVVNERICDVVFRVKESAPKEITAYINFSGIAKNDSEILPVEVHPGHIMIGYNHETEPPVETAAPETNAPETGTPAPGTPETGTPVENADVVFTFGDVTCAPGDEIAVSISMMSNTKVDSIMLQNLTYDENLLEFVGFDNFGKLIDSSMFGETGVDTELNTITLAYTRAAKKKGAICDLIFRVKDTFGETEVKMDAIVKLTSEQLTWAVDPAEISVVAGSVDFAIGTAAGAPGDTVAVDVVVTESTVASGKMTFSDVVYDTDKLTFVGYSANGQIFNTPYEFVVEGGIVPEKAVCSLVFEINEGAEGGLADIGLSAVVESDGAVLNSSVEIGVVAVGKIEFVMNTVEDVVPGDVVEVKVSINSTAPISFYEIGELIYDAAALTYMGGSYYNPATDAWEELGEGEFEGFSVAFEAKRLSGVQMKLNFEVKEGASGDYTVEFASASSRDLGIYYITKALNGVVDVYDGLLGDMNHDGDTNIKDALLLYQFSMNSGLYPIVYPGNFDVNHDGDTNIKDALLLYQFSMNALLYPISWR